MVLFNYCSLGGDTAMPGGLHARLCHVFLVRNKDVTDRQMDRQQTVADRVIKLR